MCVHKKEHSQLCPCRERAGARDMDRGQGGFLSDPSEWAPMISPRPVREELDDAARADGESAAQRGLAGVVAHRGHEHRPTALSADLGFHSIAAATSAGQGGATSADGVGHIYAATGAAKAFIPLLQVDVRHAAPLAPPRQRRPRDGVRPGPLPPADTAAREEQHQPALSADTGHAATGVWPLPPCPIPAAVMCQPGGCVVITG